MAHSVAKSLLGSALAGTPVTATGGLCSANAISASAVWRPGWSQECRVADLTLTLTEDHTGFVRLPQERTRPPSEYGRSTAAIAPSGSATRAASGRAPVARRSVKPGIGIEGMNRVRKDQTCDGLVAVTSRASRLRRRDSSARPLRVQASLQSAASGTNRVATSIMLSVAPGRHLPFRAQQREDEGGKVCCPETGARQRQRRLGFRGFLIQFSLCRVCRRQGPSQVASMLRRFSDSARAYSPRNLGMRKGC